MTQSVHLLVDVGNSRIKWNFHLQQEGAFEQQTQAFAWNPHMLSHLLDQHWGSLTRKVTSIMVSNVAGPEAQQTLAQWCQTNWNIKPAFVATAQIFGEIKNGYDDYQELGVDRWLAIIAAHHFNPNSVNIVIDCGSAITVDSVMPDGRHFAGPIIPGNDALTEKLLSKYSLEKSESQISAKNLQVIVKNTKNAVVNGVNFVESGGIVELVTQSIEALDSSMPIKIIVCGGAAQEVLPLSTLSLIKSTLTNSTLAKSKTKKERAERSDQLDCIYEPDLVLKGLQVYINSTQ